MLMAPRIAREREMLVESLYSVIALVFVLVAGLCDAATVVDVYRLIQYDMSGVPFGSRLASLNHHAASLDFSPHADLSRTVLMIPLRELNMTFVKALINICVRASTMLFALIALALGKMNCGFICLSLQKMAIYNEFLNVAEELGFKVNLKHKKINISNPRVAWEHEQFSRLRITAATLSELSAAPELLERTGVLVDNRHFVNETAIVRSVKLIAESLVRHIYRHQGKNIQISAVNSSLAVNPSYIRSWLDVLSRTPRVAPYLSKDDPLVMVLKEELEDHTDEVNLQRVVLDGMFTFYDSTRATLNVCQVASVTFDLLLLLVLGSYLIVLFSFLVITTRGLDDLISLFRRPPSRKVKTA